jgi:hypothetical protein
MRKPMLVAMLLVVCASMPAWAQSVPAGSEFQVNTFTTGNQELTRWFATTAKGQAVPYG